MHISLVRTIVIVGPKWFDMRAAERTESLENDLTLLSLRRSLFPKEFYRRSDLKPGQLPKFCQVGSLVRDPLDGPQVGPSAAERLDADGGRSRRVRKARTLAEELLADAQFMRHAKRVYGRSQAAKQKREGILRNKLRIQRARQRMRDRRKSALDTP